VKFVFVVLTVAALVRALPMRSLAARH